MKAKSALDNWKEQLSGEKKKRKELEKTIKEVRRIGAAEADGGGWIERLIDIKDGWVDGGTDGQMK